MNTYDYDKGLMLMQNSRNRSFMDLLNIDDYALMNETYNHAISRLKNGLVEYREIVELYEYLAPDLIDRLIRIFLNDTKK